MLWKVFALGVQLHIIHIIHLHIQGVFFSTGPLPKSSKYKKVDLGLRLGVSRTIYVNLDSPNLGSPYFNILVEAQCKKTP